MEKTTKIKQVGIFATPEDMKSHQEYLSLFNGSGSAHVAQTCAWTTWNLASKLTEAPKDSYNITLTKREVNILISNLDTAVAWGASGEHKKELIKLSEEFNTIID
jgi:hypothetical protein